MSNRASSPRAVGFVSPISDTNIKDEKEKSHNPLKQAAHYLKNAVTLESKDDEKERERHITDHAHVNDHGGRRASQEFWEHHGKHGEHGGHVEATNEPVGHITAKKETGGPVMGTLL